MPFRTLDNLDVAGKRVLLRADLNVPVRDGKITDLTRIERLSPTIRELAGKGAKVSTKLELLGNLLSKVDVLVIGGAMANTFLAAQGVAVGKSLQEAELHDTARGILAQAKGGRCEIVLPLDAVIATELKPNVPTRTVGINDVPADAMILDLSLIHI